MNAYALAFSQGSETVVVSMATEVGEKDAGFFVLVVKICLRMLQIFIFTVLATLHRTRLVAAVTRGGKS